MTHISNFKKTIAAFQLANPSTDPVILTSPQGKELLDIDIFSNMDCSTVEGTCMTKYFAYGADCAYDQCNLSVWRLNTPGVYEAISRQTPNIDLIFHLNESEGYCYENGPHGPLFCEMLQVFVTE